MSESSMSVDSVDIWGQTSVLRQGILGILHSNLLVQQLSVFPMQSRVVLTTEARDEWDITQARIGLHGRVEIQQAMCPDSHTVFYSVIQSICICLIRYPCNHTCSCITNPHTKCSSNLESSIQDKNVKYLSKRHKVISIFFAKCFFTWQVIIWKWIFHYNMLMVNSLVASTFRRESETR